MSECLSFCCIDIDYFIVQNDESDQAGNNDEQRDKKRNRTDFESNSGQICDLLSFDVMKKCRTITHVT